MTTSDLQKLEAETLGRNLADFGEGYDLGNEVLTLLNEGEATLSGQRWEDEATLVRLALCTRHFNSLRWALELLAKGYLQQSLALVRMALEDWAAAKYLGIRPNEADLFIEMAENPFKRNPKMPGFAQMLNVIGGEPKARASEVYDFLSTHTHPRPAGVSAAFHRDEEGIWLHVGPHYDREDFLRGLYVWLPVGQMMFRVVGELEEQLAGTVDKAWAGKVLKTTKAIVATLSNIGTFFTQNRSIITDTAVEASGQ